MWKTLEKHDIFILRRYLGTTRCHDGTQNFLKRKFDTSALKWHVARVFWIIRTKIISKNKRTPLKVSGLYCTLLPNSTQLILLYSESVWYPNYSATWDEGHCLNSASTGVDSTFLTTVPNYATQEECCRGSYMGQASGACLREDSSAGNENPYFL